MGDDEIVHELSAEGIIWCRGIHVVRAVRQDLGLTVTSDETRTTCGVCITARNRARKLVAVA